MPAGARTVDLQFEDPAYKTGRLVTFIALALALALLVAGAVFRPRNMEPA